MGETLGLKIRIFDLKGVGDNVLKKSLAKIEETLTVRNFWWF